jgi:hypothetical protein
MAKEIRMSPPKAEPKPVRPTHAFGDVPHKTTTFVDHPAGHVPSPKNPAHSEGNPKTSVRYKPNTSKKG